MAMVTVQVWDATGNKRQDVEMPDDAPVNRLIAVLLSKMNFPQYAPDGNSLYFIGNPEGVSDIYRYYFSDNHLERVTAVQTGVAGITEMSPALGVASKSGANKRSPTWTGRPRRPPAR